MRFENIQHLYPFTVLGAVGTFAINSQPLCFSEKLSTVRASSFPGFIRKVLFMDISYVFELDGIPDSIKEAKWRNKNRNAWTGRCDWTNCARIRYVTAQLQRHQICCDKTTSHELIGANGLIHIGRCLLTSQLQELYATSLIRSPRTVFVNW